MAKKIPTPGIQRDRHSQALLATDVQALAAYKAAKAKRDAAGKLVLDINSIMQRLTRIEQHLGLTE